MEPPRYCVVVLSAATLAGAMLAAGAGQAATCKAAVHLKYGAPVELEGTLNSGTGHHDAQGDFSYVYLALDKGVCVDAAPDDELAVATPEPVVRLQVAGDAIGKDLPLGRRVKVAGTLFGAHTMWHAEDVLIDATTVEAK